MTSKYIAAIFFNRYTFAEGNSTASLCIFDVEEGKRLDKALSFESNPGGFTFNSEATKASVVWKDRLSIYDIDSGEITRTIEANVMLTSFNLDSSLLAVMSIDRIVRIYDISTGNVLASWNLLRTHTHPYKALHFTMDSSQIMILSINGEISFCDAMSGVRRYHFGGVRGSTNCVIASFYCNKLACYNSRGKLSVFEIIPPATGLEDPDHPTALISSYTPPTVFSQDTHHEISTLFIDGLGERLAFGTSDGSVTVLDGTTGDTLCKLAIATGVGRYILSVSLNNDGTRILVRHYNNTIIIYDCNSGASLFPLLTPQGTCNGANFVGEVSTFLLK